MTILSSMRRWRSVAAALVAAFAASAIWAAPAQAAEPTELTLEQRSEDVSYGGTLVLVAKLTAAGKPLAARSVSLHAGRRRLT